MARELGPDEDDGNTTRESPQAVLRRMPKMSAPPGVAHLPSGGNFPTVPIVPGLSTFRNKTRSSMVAKAKAVIGKSMLSAKDVFVLPDADELHDGAPKAQAQDSEGLWKYFTEQEANTYRGRVRALLCDNRFDSVMGLIIVGNILLMVFQTNSKVHEARDKNYHAPAAQDAFEYIFLACYTIELGMRMFAYMHYVAKSKWFWMDFTIVIFSYLDIILAQAATKLPNLKFLRIFRIFRLLRVVRLLRFLPELYSMVRGFVMAMMAMVWGGVMIFILLLCLGILVVEVIYPLSDVEEGLDEWCLTALQSVQMCMLLFFQTLLAGDSWGRCTIPIIRKYPWTVCIWMPALVSVSLGFTNLILAVIVERGNRSNEADAVGRMKEQRKKRAQSVERIKQTLKNIDKDNSGTFTLDELQEGLTSNKELQQLLALLNIRHGDFLKTFELIANGTSEAGYEDLVGYLRQVEEQGLNTQVMMLKLSLLKLRRNVQTLAVAKKASVRSTSRQEHSTVPSTRVFDCVGKDKNS